jgi:hypothetical protein
MKGPNNKRSPPSSSSQTSGENQNQKKKVAKKDDGRKTEAKESKEAAASSSSVVVGAVGGGVERVVGSARGLPRVEERQRSEEEVVIDDNKTNGDRFGDEGRKLKRKADADLNRGSDNDVQVLGGPFSKARRTVEGIGGVKRERVGVGLDTSRDGGNRRESKEMSSDSNRNKTEGIADGNATDFYESDAETNSKTMTKSKSHQSQNQANTDTNPPMKSSKTAVMTSPATVRRSPRISKLSSSSPHISCSDTDVTGQISTAKTSRATATATAAATFKSEGGEGKGPKKNARQFFLVVVAGKFSTFSAIFYSLTSISYVYSNIRPNTLHPRTLCPNPYLPF